MGCSFFITCSAVLLFLLGLNQGALSPLYIQWLEILLSSLIKLVLCMNFAIVFTYAAELFPTELRGLALGCCLLFGRAASVFSIVFTSIASSLEIHPMVMMVFGSALSLPIAYLLPETKDKELSN